MGGLVSSINELLMARARTAHAALPLATSPTPVGAVYSIGASGSTPIPAGSAAGDFMLIVTNGGSTLSFTLANSTQLVAPTQYYNGGNPAYGLYSYILTSTDIANGTIPLTYSGFAGLFVAHGASAIDAQSASLYIGSSARPVEADIPSITTVSNDTLIVALVDCNTQGTVTGTWTNATGYTQQLAQQYSYRGILINTMSQASAGATGDANGISFNNNNFGTMAGYMVALKA